MDDNLPLTYGAIFAGWSRDLFSGNFRSTCLIFIGSTSYDVMFVWKCPVWKHTEKQLKTILCQIRKGLLVLQAGKWSVKTRSTNTLEVSKWQPRFYWEYTLPMPNVFVSPTWAGRQTGITTLSPSVGLSVTPSHLKCVGLLKQAIYVFSGTSLGTLNAPYCLPKQ